LNVSLHSDLGSKLNDMAKKKKELVTLALDSQYKYYTLCTEGHKHWYPCGTVIEPPPTRCDEEGCGAAVIDFGKRICNEA
jgi:hypothetical protein